MSHFRSAHHGSRSSSTHAKGTSQCLGLNIDFPSNIFLGQADKAASSASGGFSMFGGRTEKWENAADLYTQAANAFRMQKQSMFVSGLA